MDTARRLISESYRRITMARQGEEPAIVRMDEPIFAVGVGADTSDKTIFKDSAALGKRFAEARRAHPFEALRPRLFVAATSGYDRDAGTYRYALGDAVASLDGAPAELERITLPAGTYAAFAVRPILGFLWGPAIGRAYGRIYGSWLPRSAWAHDPRVAPDGRRIEHFEYHDERASRKRNPEMEIRVPVRPKD
jgi:predicted transcriptional regulator YdeE